MTLDRTRRPLLIAGLVVLALAATALAFIAATAGSDLLSMTCSGSGTGNCTTEHPLIYTALNFAQRSASPLLVAGTVLLASSLAVRAIAAPAAAPTATALSNGAEMTGAEPTGAPAIRTAIGEGTDDAARPLGAAGRPPRARARALWILAAALLICSAALGIWSASPAAQNSMMGCYGLSDCRTSLWYILNQLSYLLVPAGMEAGLLVLGLALLVTFLRPGRRDVRDDLARHGDGAHGDKLADSDSDSDTEAEAVVGLTRRSPASARFRSPAHPDTVWDGRSHDPFRRPAPDSGR